ncbi:hypothetical protein NIASO_13765 [Niabella soli DSM 19437]|uniref:Uncharacterized protein n=1 Tax=Niabella soli DSM 19437 TaxID=929713 RepID=W0F436_9BACT|nr:hypothetical protein NIASO_13765 [Niabella soli DSM 19437]
MSLQGLCAYLDAFDQWPGADTKSAHAYQIGVIFNT